MYQGEHSIQSQVRSFMYNVYGLMSAALFITAGAAYYMAKTPGVFEAIYTHSWALLLIVILQFALVIGLSAFLPRMSFATALLVFYR